MYTQDQFAEQIKAKYPDYANIPNQELVKKIIAKYPQYADKVDMTISEAIPSTGTAQSGGFLTRFKENLKSGLGLEGKPGLLTAGKSALNIANPAKIPERLSGAKEMIKGSVNRAGERWDRAMKSTEGIFNPDPTKTYSESEFGPQTPVGMLGAAGEIAAIPITAAIGLFKPEVEGAFKQASDMIPQETKTSISENVQAVLDKIPDNLKNLYGDAFAGLGLYAIPSDINLAKNVYSLGKKGVEKLGQGISAISNKIGGGISSTANFVTKQVTGLPDDTINILKNEPVLYSAAKNGEISRSSLADDVVNALDDKIDDLSSTGAKYEGIRGSAEKIRIPDVKDTLKAKGITIKKGLLNFDDTNIILEADKTAIQKAYNEIVNLGNVSNANSVLNLRSKLDDLIGWDSKVTSKGESIVKALRGQVDDVAKTTVKGLKEADSSYGAIVNELKKLKKDFFNTDGTLKDNAMSKIANLTGKGKEQILSRLEEASPGITDKIRAVSALENVEVTSGLKVGHYVKGAILGGTAAQGNPLGFIAGAIVSNPKIAAEAIMTYGKIANFGSKLLTNMVTKIKAGIPFTLPEAKAMTQIMTSMADKIGVGVGLVKGVEDIIDKETPKTKEEPDKQAGDT